jgi:hypothetical protein
LAAGAGDTARLWAAPGGGAGEGDRDGDRDGVGLGVGLGVAEPWQGPPPLLARRGAGDNRPPERVLLLLSGSALAALAAAAVARAADALASASAWALAAFLGGRKLSAYRSVLMVEFRSCVLGLTQPTTVVLQRAPVSDSSSTCVKRLWRYGAWERPSSLARITSFRASKLWLIARPSACG